MKAPGRNDPCPCGSGLKYKKCCERKTLLQKKQVTRIGSAPGLGQIVPPDTQNVRSLAGRVVKPINANETFEEPSEGTSEESSTKE